MSRAFGGGDLDLAIRLIKITYSGSWTGSQSDPALVTTPFDSLGVGESLYTSIYGKLQDDSQSIQKALSKPFYRQVFSPYDDRFMDTAAGGPGSGTETPLATYIFGPPVAGGDSSNDYIFAMTSAGAYGATLCYQIFGSPEFVVPTEAGSVPLAPAVFGNVVMRDLMVSGSGNGSFAGAIFGFHDEFTPSLAGLILTPGQSMAGKIFGTRDTYEAFFLPDAPPSIAQRILALEEHVEERLVEIDESFASINDQLDAIRSRLSALV